MNAPRPSRQETGLRPRSFVMQASIRCLSARVDCMFVGHCFIDPCIAKVRFMAVLPGNPASPSLIGSADLNEWAVGVLRHSCLATGPWRTNRFILNRPSNWQSRTPDTCSPTWTRRHPRVGDHRQRRIGVGLAERGDFRLRHALVFPLRRSCSRRSRSTRPPGTSR